jgi:glyoxylase-like metal-dependent hydrolase (beta-lactamase superfamily II)
MKMLHREDLFSWSGFDADRNIDFNSFVWARPGGSVVIDPMPVSDHDLAHLQSLGAVAWIVITNSDHVRATEALAEATSARIAGPSAEQHDFPLACDRWLADGEALVEGLQVLEMNGAKTPGELALLLEGTTLITGDLVRAHRGGRLMMLPDAKLVDREAACASVHRLAELPGIEAVLVGDGWPVFRDGGQRLRELAASVG